MTAPDMTAAVEAGARAHWAKHANWLRSVGAEVEAVEWAELPEGGRDAITSDVRHVLTAALPRILEQVAAEFEAEADDKDREADENADMDDDWRAQRACGARDAYRAAAKRLRGAGA